MKTTLLTLGAVILSVATINLYAGDTLRSPHDASNQGKTLANTESHQNVAVQKMPDSSFRSPRAAANQNITVSGKETVMVKCPVLGSPHSITDLGNTAHTSCCNLTLAECSTMDQMRK